MKTEKVIIQPKLSDNELYTLYLTNVANRIEDIKRYKYLGYTFTDISTELCISNSELWRMYVSKKDCYIPLKNALDTDVRDEVFSTLVENALYRKCVGYYVNEQQAIKVKHEYYNKKGKKCCEEQVEVVEVQKYISPEFNAQRFYLLNNKRDKYSNENRIDNNSLSTESLIESLKNFTIAVKRKAEE